MGGNGALNIAARNPGMYKSVSAFAPIANSSSDKSEFCGLAFKEYFKTAEEKDLWDCSKNILKAEKMPPGIIHTGTHD